MGCEIMFKFFLKKDLSIYLEGEVTERDRPERERFPIHWLTPQMLTTVGAGPA